MKHRAGLTVLAAHDVLRLDLARVVPTLISHQRYFGPRVGPRRFTLVALRQQLQVVGSLAWRDPAPVVDLERLPAPRNWPVHASPDHTMRHVAALQARVVDEQFAASASSS
jgi:hypothetical protein